MQIVDTNSGIYASNRSLNSVVTNLTIFSVLLVLDLLI
jgi:hypothetical protein